MIASSFFKNYKPPSLSHSSASIAIAAILAVLTFGCCEVSIQSSGERQSQLEQVKHQVSFHEQFAQGLYEDIPLEDPIQVFRYVFANLDHDVKVLPTENYYYFNFTARGRYIWGNLRLAPADRDQGVIHFAYFDYENQSWYRYIRLTSAEGVVVKHITSLVYSVEFNGKRVVFRLNNLSQTQPINLVLLNGEIFLGQTFDESGFYFWLVYSSNFKHFLWILNEERNNWYFVKIDQDLFLHPHSSFVFFNDTTNRKILIGVYAWNVQSNNYFDGPFDQLPDNFIQTTKFRTYLEEAYPEVKGLVNNRGEYFDRDDERVSVMPYLIYGSLNDVKSRLKKCKRINKEIQHLYQCLCEDVKFGPNTMARKKDHQKMSIRPVP